MIYKCVKIGQCYCVLRGPFERALTSKPCSLSGCTTRPLQRGRRPLELVVQVQALGHRAVPRRGGRRRLHAGHHEGQAERFVKACHDDLILLWEIVKILFINPLLLIVAL